MNYEETTKKVYLGTDNLEEFEKWCDYLKENSYDFKTNLKKSGKKWDCRVILTGYKSKTIERIKKDIGFYYDEED